MRRTTATACFDSPIGAILLHADDAALVRLKILPHGTAKLGDGPDNHPILAAAIRQLSEYFAGTRQHFDVPLQALPGAEGRMLQAAIAAIPYGETRNYGAVADACGSSARAIGQACKTNAYPLLIPCHRVISRAGPEYYSAGDGPKTKSWLLDFEYAHLPPEKRTRLL
jgi:methylated-DNA-[protein]-cysteine S-methyltransferase